MLCITRRLDDEIIINDTIRIKVIDITGNRVRLGFTAPDDVSIRRAEVMDTGPQHIADVIPLTIREIRQARKAG